MSPSGVLQSLSSSVSASVPTLPSSSVHLSCTMQPSEARPRLLTRLNLQRNSFSDYLIPRVASVTLFLIPSMKALFTIILLVLSNIFMTFAWYGHLKLQEMKISTSWPLILVILFSWGLAFFEYCAQVPANRIGFSGNGGPFSLVQLKVIQEVVSLVVFTLIVTVLFKGESLHWNHLAAFGCLVLAVFFVFLK